MFFLFSCSTNGCPIGQEITTFEECIIAVERVGHTVPTNKRFEINNGNGPKGCSWKNTQNHILFNTCNTENCGANAAANPVCGGAAGIQTVTCSSGYHETGSAGNNLACTACVNQANCAVSTANTCSTTASFTANTICTSVTADGYYLDGEVVKTCAAVADSSSRTCNGADAAGIQTVTCSSGYHETGSAGNNLACIKSSQENENVVVVITEVTSETEAEDSIENLNTAAGVTEGGSSSGGAGDIENKMSEEELKKQYEQRKKVLIFLDVGNITIDTKVTLLELVTESTTTLDVTGAELAMNVSETILGDLLGETGTEGNVTATVERREQLMQKVGGVVSNVVSALAFVGGSTDISTSNGVEDLDGGSDASSKEDGQKDEEYTRAIKEVYNTIDLLSDVQLMGVLANAAPVILSTKSFELISQKSTKVGKETIHFDRTNTNTKQNLTSISVPTNLGENFQHGVETDMQMTSWSINLHDNEKNNVHGGTFSVRLYGVGITVQSFGGGDSANSEDPATVAVERHLQSSFTRSIRRGITAALNETTTTTTGLGAGAVAVSVQIIQVRTHNTIKSPENTAAHRLRRLGHLFRQHLRRVLLSTDTTSETAITLDFAVKAPSSMSSEQMKQALSNHLRSQGLSSDLTKDVGHTIRTTTEISNSRSLNYSPAGGITSLKIKQNGNEVSVYNAGWFVLKKQWDGAELERRNQRMQKIQNATRSTTTGRETRRLDTTTPTKRVNRTVAICNKTNTGKQWDITCGVMDDNSSTASMATSFYKTSNPSNQMKGNVDKHDTVEVVHTTDLVNSTAPTHQESMNAEIRGACPLWYIEANNIFLALSVLSLFLGVLRHFLWKMEDIMRLKTTTHHYNDWVRLYVLSGIMITLTTALVTFECSPSNTNATVLGIHVVLVLSSIASLCLTVITLSVTIYLSPKSIVGCFPNKNMDKLYAAQRKKRAHYTKSQSNYYLAATPQTKKKRNSIFFSKEHLSEAVENVEDVVDRVTHTKKKKTDFVPESAGPMEVYARWHRNWPWLMLLLCALLIPLCIITLHLLSTNGVQIAGDTFEAARDRPTLTQEARDDIIQSEESIPSLTEVLKRVQNAKEFHGNLLTCEEGDHYTLNMECPLVTPEPTPADDRCLYWDESLRLWSDRGCVLVSSTIEETVCQCNHLTDFGAAIEDSVRVWGKVFEEPDMLQLFVVHWYALLSIGLLLAVFLAVSGYGHRYDVLLQRRSSMRGSLIALHVFGQMLKRQRARRKTRAAREEKQPLQNTVVAKQLQEVVPGIVITDHPSSPQALQQHTTIEMVQGKCIQ